MDNKETLQSHNTRLSTNNDSLNSLIDKINSLPEPKDPTLQDKSIEIIENGTQIISADEGYDGLNTIEVNVNLDAGGKYAPRWIRFTSYTGTDLDEEIDNLDTSNLTSMASMFQQVSKVTSLNLSGFNTSNVTNMSNMFYICSGVTEIDVSNFNTSNVTNMYQMFSQCGVLTNLDLSNFDTSKVSNMGSMFQGCGNLRKLDIRNFTFSMVSSYGNMFSSVPIDCEIIVKDDGARSWVLARRSDFTNVKTVAELEV